MEIGIRGANLYSFVGPNPPADPRDWHHERMTTRALARLEFPGDVPNGATVWLSACWVTARGATSPAAEPTPFTLQGGLGTTPSAAA
jgi:hypothetical protein